MNTNDRGTQFKLSLARPSCVPVVVFWRFLVFFIYLTPTQNSPSLLAFYRCLLCLTAAAAPKTPSPSSDPVDVTWYLLSVPSISALVSLCVLLYLQIDPPRSLDSNLCLPVLLLSDVISGKKLHPDTN